MWSNPRPWSSKSGGFIHVYTPLKLRLVLSFGFATLSSLVNGRFRNQLGWLEFCLINGRNDDDCYDIERRVNLGTQGLPWNRGWSTDDSWCSWMVVTGILIRTCAACGTPSTAAPVTFGIPPVSVPETNGKSLAWSENLRLTPWFHDPNVGFPVNFPVNQFDVWILHLEENWIDYDRLWW